MPPATRSRTAADSTNEEATTTDATPDGDPDAESATRVDAGTGSQSAADTTAALGSPPDTTDLVRTAGRMATLRVKEVKAVADDIASTTRRPDAVMHGGGLAGLAALGILEWPAAAAVGVAVGRRRAPSPATTWPTA